MSRHRPRLCASCGAPLASQRDTCWKCGKIVPGVLAAFWRDVERIVGG